MSVGIRPSTYQGEAGFLIYGRDPAGRNVSIFATLREDAERIRDKVKRGEQTVPIDWIENR